MGRRMGHHSSLIHGLVTFFPAMKVNEKIVIQAILNIKKACQLSVF